MAATRIDLNALAGQLAAFGEAGGADVFTEISREIDKQPWFIDAHQRA